MKRNIFRLILSVALMMCYVNVLAQTQSVNYIDANGNEQTCPSATVVTNETGTLNEGWYVVTGANVQTGTLTCSGAVHLILADGAKLTATGGYYQAGIKVSGDGNSLTIYGQSTLSGQLVASGGAWGAGIGGEAGANGSNITINGGTITATGGNDGAGIGGGQASNIIIATSLLVRTYVGNDSTIIFNDGTDLASDLAGKNKIVLKPITYIDENGEKQIAHAGLLTKDVML